MTYTTVLQRLRFRMRDVKNLPLMYHEDGALFTIVNEGARELFRRTRDYEKIGDLTIVASQYDYDIPSEIGSDVGEISQIVVTTGSKILKPRGNQDFLRAVENQITSDDVVENGDIIGTPAEYFRIWENGKTLRIFPTPNEADTAKVYYFAKEPLIDYSNANLTRQIRIRDEYLESLLVFCKGLVYGIIRDDAKADKKKMDAEVMIMEVKATLPNYNVESAVKYHED